jgi:alpha/beta hydrolase fold
MTGYDFRVRLYPAAEPSGAVLVSLHGGAFMFGSLDMPEADEIARRLTDRGIGVVSVDYTLAISLSSGSPAGPGAFAPGTTCPSLPELTPLALVAVTTSCEELAAGAVRQSTEDGEGGADPPCGPAVISLMISSRSSLDGSPHSGWYS